MLNHFSGFLCCHATRASDQLSPSLLPDAYVMHFNHEGVMQVKILNYRALIITEVQTAFHDKYKFSIIFKFRFRFGIRPIIQNSVHTIIKPLKHIEKTRVKKTCI